MTLRIESIKPISEIQAEFNKAFPYLKLEFFKNNVYQQPDFTPQQIIPKQFKLGNIQKALKDGYLEFGPSMKVKELEKKFKDEFSLSVQIFRCSGNVWLQTTMTDNWTLQQQNDHGREISELKQENVTEEINDYDLNRDSDH